MKAERLKGFLAEHRFTAAVRYIYYRQAYDAEWPDGSIPEGFPDLAAALLNSALAALD